MKGIDYPVSLKDINEFEKQNPSVSITVLGYDRKSVYPLRNSANTVRDHNIVLMSIEEDGVKHYCLVKNLSRLLASQVSKRNGERDFCLRCLNPFWSRESLNKHKEYCNEHEAVKIEVPKKGTMFEFKNYYRSEKVPFMLTLSVILNRCKRANQTLKVVILNNTKNMNHSAFAIISSVSITKYINQN